MAESTAYDLYMKNLSKVKRLPNQEQKRLHTSDSPRERAKLHEQALLIVLYVFQRMQARDRLVTVEAFDMDALQEANLAALQALPNWDPVRGTLATWLVPHIKGALLDYANTHTSGGIGSKHNKLIQVAIDEVIASEELSEAQDSPGMEDAMPITLEESLTYDTNVLPDAEREALLDQIRYHAWAVRHGNLLTEYYLQDTSIKDLATRYGVSYDTINRRIANAEEDLKNVFSAEYFDQMCGN